MSNAQIALAWVADRPAVSSVILGARTLEQLTDNLAAADLVLTEEETGAGHRLRPGTRGLPVRPFRQLPAHPADHWRASRAELTDLLDLDARQRQRAGCDGRGDHDR